MVVLSCGIQNMKIQSYITKVLGFYKHLFLSRITKIKNDSANTSKAKGPETIFANYSRHGENEV